MLYETFDSVRTKLSGITALKSVQWYNAQYEGTIYVSPVAFVEFPERIPLEQVAGTANRADFALRIHIASAYDEERPYDQSDTYRLAALP